MHTLIAAFGVLLVLAMIVLGGLGGMAIALLLGVIVAGIALATYLSRRGRRSSV
jgi:hypothetical protein